MWRRLIDRLHDERGIKKLKLARRVIEFIDRADDALRARPPLRVVEE
jgi:hypothetical protein